MSSMKKLGFFTGAIIVLLALLAIGDIDYSISKNLINKESVFGEFFNVLGEIPANFALLLGTTILYGARKRTSKVANLLKSFIAIPFMFLFSELTVIASVRYIYEFSEGGFPKSAFTMAAIAGLILFAISIYAVIRLDRTKFSKYRKQGLILILLVVSEILVVNVLKMIWARPRMRSITSIDQFKHWYEISGPLNSEEFKSFPSGHTANAFVMLAFSMFLPKDRSKLIKGFTAFAIIWGVCTAISRVILGAHFLSDVFVGGYITILLFYMYEKLFGNDSSESV